MKFVVISDLFVLGSFICSKDDIVRRCGGWKVVLIICL